MSSLDDSRRRFEGLTVSSLRQIGQVSSGEIANLSVAAANDDNNDYPDTIFSNAFHRALGAHNEQNPIITALLEKTAPRGKILDLINGVRTGKINLFELLEDLNKRKIILLKMIEEESYLGTDETLHTLNAKIAKIHQLMMRITGLTAKIT